MHLRVILPIIGDTFVDLIHHEVTAWTSSGTKVDVVPLDRGPASIECEYDEALAAPGILLDRLFERASDAVALGEADVLVLGCTGMLGVAAMLQDRLAAAGPSCRSWTRRPRRSRGWRARCGCACARAGRRTAPLPRSSASRDHWAERTGTRLIQGSLPNDLGHTGS